MRNDLHRGTVQPVLEVGLEGLELRLNMSAEALDRTIETVVSIALQHVVGNLIVGVQIRARDDGDDMYLGVFAATR
jgi:hypothetical protein